MKRILLGVIGLLCLCVACQRKDLSFKPGEIWPDGKGLFRYHFIFLGQN